MECPVCHSENKDGSRFCSSCAAPLAATPVHISNGTITRTIAGPVPLPSSSALVAGKYRIVGEVGRGGMGIVFKAEDIKLKRCVALKFLPPALSDHAELRERFLVEAQAAAALSHPNICVIHEVGEDADRPFFAMEFVEGETLRDKLRAGPLAPEEALGIVIQVATGLSEAHAKGIVHRDIKSANIMITDKGQAKVMDFGLAKLRGGPSLTKSHTTLGTVAYMSPEQARGEEVDQRSDIWSLGVVLYEMLTGELPFKGGGDISVIHSILHEDPAPIKARKPPIPEDLQRVIGRALKKNLEARYGSAGEMLKDLGKYGETLRAEAAGPFNLRSLLKRLRRPAVAVPVALAVVVIAAGAFFYFNRQAKVRWARETALPEIERMIGENDVWRNLIPPYRLAEKAEAVLGKDPKLADLFSKCSLNIDIVTEPPGARVYLKEYATPEAEWSYLGTTPIEKIRLPVGVFRWKLEKDGYETVWAASSTWDVGSTGGKPGTVIPYHLVRKLDEAGRIPPDMVRVRGENTTVGKLEDFFIDKYEVTNKKYKEFVDAGGYRKKDFWKNRFIRDGQELTWEEAQREFMDATGLPGPSTWNAGEYPTGQGDHPVSGISWYEAAAYAEYAGKSLPTTAHWNVARGAYVPMIRWPQLGGFAILAPFSNFDSRGTVAVGSLQGMTPYGAFDLAGNVKEWCWNEAQFGRITRGGAWGDNTYEFMRQGQVPAWDRSPKNGFRCAVYPEPQAIPDKAFTPFKLAAITDYYSLKPVDDAIFRIYREQFAYDRTELDARVETREENAQGWIHEKVSFEAAYGGERIIAHLFLPSKTPPPYQTVIYFPGSASTWEKSSHNIESFYEFTMFLSFLVKNGRAVLYPVYKGTFERGVPGVNVSPTYQYTKYLTQVIKDFRRCIDYLETRPDIEGGNFAYYGMSWGGWLGAVIPAVEERLKASVLLGGSLVANGRPEVHPPHYVGRVRIPTLMLNGKYDVSPGIKPMFDLLGTPPEHKRLILYDTDHIPPRNEYIKETLSWLDKYLGPVKR